MKKLAVCFVLVVLAPTHVLRADPLDDAISSARELYAQYEQSYEIR